MKHHTLTATALLICAVCTTPATARNKPEPTRKEQQPSKEQNKCQRQYKHRPDNALTGALRALGKWIKQEEDQPQPKKQQHQE